MRQYVLAFGALSPLVLADPSTAGSTCDDLKSILARSDNVEGLAGAAISEDTWQAKSVLSGYKSCEINKLDNGVLIYFCQGEKTSSQPVADKQYTQAKNLLNSCLSSPQWTYQETSSQVGKSYFFHDQLGHGGVATSMKFRNMSSAGGKNDFDYTQTITIYPQTGHEQVIKDVQEQKVALVAPLEFCPDLKRLLEAAKMNFSGAIVKKGDRLLTKIPLKGWDRCYIYELDEEGGKTLYQSCMLSETTDKKELEEVASKIQSVLKDCLGSNWAEDDSSRRKRCPRVNYVLGDGEPEVELRTTPCGRGTEWSLHLDVDSPPKTKPH